VKRELKNHSLVVKDVQRQVSDFFALKKKARIFHGGTNSTRSRNLDHSRLINISQLNKIIEINVGKEYVLVESNVALEQLVDATLKLGFLPPVVSEFPAITVGGAIQGGAGESSSFKWGCFNEPCLEYEVVLGDGSKVIANPSKNPDLFRGIPSSCGSLGIITMAKLRLIPATLMIRLSYHRVSSYEEAVNFIDSQAKKTKKPDFIDGIMFSKTKGVIMLGYFINRTDMPIASFHKFNDEWFYLHAERVTTNVSVYEELIPTKDYLFRYDRGAFWTGREGLKILHIPFNRFTRLLLSPLFKTRTMYRFLHDARLSQQFLVQDICLPKQNTVPFIKFIDKNYGIYPLWLCPLKPTKKDILSPAYLTTDLVINVGVWGAMPEDYESFVQHNRQLEDKVYKFGGRKVLYAHAYYPKVKFWAIYDGKRYQQLRQKYAAGVVFPDIYEKTHVAGRYEPSIARGWWKLLTRS
jgi:hypothetical protein